MNYEYKAIGAPEKGRRKRGARTASDRVAIAFEEMLAEHATDGWEYMRTDLIPVDEKPGMFRRREEMHRAVMVFRRPLRTAEAPMPKSRRRRSTDDDELVLMPEKRRRGESQRAEPEIRLAHSRERGEED